MSGDLQHHLAAIGWVPTGRHAQAAQLALPTDLFMVTAHCGAAAVDGGGACMPPQLEMSVTLLRTRPERFFSKDPGQLAFALLTPAGLLALLRAPLQGATDQRMSLARFCDAAQLRTLRDALCNAGDASERMQRFAAWIEGRIRQRHLLGVSQQRVAQAASLMQRSDSPLLLSPLHAQLQVSQRQLERDFRFWLGVSPAGYSRLVRFQRAASAIAEGEALGQAAAGHAFADQSHMNRSFRQLSSMTPREFVRLAATPHRNAERRSLAGRVVLLEAPPLSG